MCVTCTNYCTGDEVPTAAKYSLPNGTDFARKKKYLKVPMVHNL